jgi:ribonuclease HI
MTIDELIEALKKAREGAGNLHVFYSDSNYGLTSISEVKFTPHEAGDFYFLDYA